MPYIAGVAKLSSLVAWGYFGVSLIMFFLKNRLLAGSAIIALFCTNLACAQTLSDFAPNIDQEGYLIRQDDVSEFNNYSESFVRDWREADPNHEDTEFGEFMYNEASTPTKLEMLRLISKDTPSISVLLHAVSMGVGIESIMQASSSFDPEGTGDMSASALSILPVLQDSKEYRYGGYELQDLERDNEAQPYKVQQVIERFFEERLVLRPYPDWFEGQYHFLASAKELDKLQADRKEVRWYKTKSTEDVEKRPVFVSLYEGSETVLIDGEERIKEALAEDADSVLPVVFIFNRLRERSVDQLDYPKTLRGIQQAYFEKSLMLTPVPEWQLGEYHMMIAISEFYEIFEIPEEDDFEAEAWLKLLNEAEDYAVNNTSFLVVVVSGDREEKKEEEADKQILSATLGLNLNQYAIWDDPRTEADFKYVTPGDGKPLSLENIMGKGMIFNRPDLLAALNALGVQKVPVSYYYVDSARVKPYVKGFKALLDASKNILPSPAVPVGGGGFTPCASPPCVEQ